ncbi:HlyD family secretion protein [Clostridium sp.]|uniref:HlyD family secretion protein n=1 Tax=Clostridium sp. TaxID=1506 RepID=UPI002FDD31D0
MKNKLKNMKPIIIFTVILIGLSIFFVIKNTMDKNSNEFQFSGTVEADELSASSELSGKIKDIRVEEGTKVKAGDIIAVLDSDESTISVNQANISLENAENELGKVNDGTRVEEINAQKELVTQSESLVTQGEAALETAQNNLSNAQSNYDYKKKTYDDHLNLNEKGYESNESLDKIKNDLDNAKTSLNNAKSALSSANAQLKSYKAQLAAATDKLNLLVNSTTSRDKATANYGIQQAEQNMELSKIALDKSNIKASSDGIVETVNFKKGEYVSLGSPIITLLDNNNMYIKIYVPEKTLPYVKLNKEVTMKSDFIKNKIIKGKISYISKEAEFTPMNIVTKEDRMKLVYEVKIKISDNLQYVKSGMLLDVTLK